MPFPSLPIRVRSCSFVVSVCVAQLNHTRSNERHDVSATMLQVAVSRAFFYTAFDMVKTILLSIIICAVPVFFVALMLSSAYHRIIELRRRCHATAERVRLAIEEREAGLRQVGGGDVPAKELKDAAEHLLQEPTHPAIAELVLRAVQADRLALEQVLETTRLPPGQSSALETLYTTHTELEQAARQSMEVAQAFEKTSGRFPGMLFASAGRSH